MTLGGTTIEIALLAALHFVFIARMCVAQTAARAERELDSNGFGTSLA